MFAVTMTSAYINKLAAALNRDDDGDSEPSEALPLSAAGIINAQARKRRGGSDSIIDTNSSSMVNTTTTTNNNNNLGHAIRQKQWHVFKMRGSAPGFGG